MNVGWDNLNRAQEPGRFAFRDGTIDVTFAEIAIWKARPNAQFRLMRKNPIRDQIAYVLGKLIEGDRASKEVDFTVQKLPDGKMSVSVVPFQF